MKQMFITIGLAFLFGIAALFVTFIFIEGWGTIATIISNALAYLIAGYFMGKIKPKSILYSGIVILLPLFILDPPGTFYFNGLFNLLSNPSQIDERSFYFLLPLMAIVSVYIGLYVGKRMNAKSKPSVSL
jgi:hypothetical protein